MVVRYTLTETRNRLYEKTVRISLYIKVEFEILIFEIYIILIVGKVWISR